MYVVVKCKHAAHQPAVPRLPKQFHGRHSKTNRHNHVTMQPCLVLLFTCKYHTTTGPLKQPLSVRSRVFCELSRRLHYFIEVYMLASEDGRPTSACVTGVDSVQLLSLSTNQNMKPAGLPTDPTMIIRPVLLFDLVFIPPVHLLWPATRRRTRSVMSRPIHHLTLSCVLRHFYETYTQRLAVGAKISATRAGSFGGTLPTNRQLSRHRK